MRRHRAILLLAALVSLQSASTEAAAPSPVRRHEPFTLTLTAARHYPNPYLMMPGDDTSPGFVVGTFSGPEGRTIEIDGFWDGGDTWKIRMAPTSEGTWTYRTRSSDPGLDGVTGSFECGPSSSHGFVRIHPDNPFAFAYDDGNPFFWQGDTHVVFYDWDGRFRMDDGTFQTYWQTRAAQGFNAIYFGSWLFKKKGNFATNECGPNFLGRSPDRLHPPFWRCADRRVAYLNDLGLVPGLGLGFPDQGIVAFGRERLMRGLRFLIARYSAYNIMWDLFGEWDEGLPPADLSWYGNALERLDPYDHLASTHATGIFASHEPWVDLSVAQRSCCHASEIAAARALYRKPFVNVEFDWGASDEERRRTAWTIVTSGGHVGYGEDWVPESPGLLYMKHLGDFFRAGKTFWLLQPHRELVREGRAHLLAIPGREYVVYLPEGGTVSVDLSQASGPFRVEWYDPRTGATTPGKSTSGGGVRRFTAPDGSDWALYVSGPRSSGVPPR